MCKTHSIILIVLLVLVSQSLAAENQSKQPPDSLDGPPLVTAKAWAIGDGKSGKLLWGRNESASRNMASTTKIMTAWIVLELAREDPKLMDEMVTVSERADKTGGTTAGIRVDEQFRASELLYGLLLPSGNDAAVAIAETFGRHFGQPDAPGKIPADQSLALFVAEMNRRAEKLGMMETRYFDPHGNSKNRSSARDLLRLAHTALQNKPFAKYVQTRRHRCMAIGLNDTKREVVWKNTNQLLNIEGFDGIKTGMTGGAGACLVSSGRRGNDHLLVVVLGSRSKDGRFIDSRNLYRWAWRERLSGQTVTNRKK